MSLYSKSISCEKHICKSFLIQSKNFSFLIVVFSQFKFDITIDICVLLVPFDFLPSSFYLYSKWIADLNIKCNTTKLQEDNRGESLDDLGPGDVFLDKTPKAQPIKEVIVKLDLIKIKNLCF